MAIGRRRDGGLDENGEWARQGCQAGRCAESMAATPTECPWWPVPVGTRWHAARAGPDTFDKRRRNGKQRAAGDLEGPLFWSRDTLPGHFRVDDIRSARYRRASPSATQITSPLLSTPRSVSTSRSLHPRWIVPGSRRSRANGRYTRWGPGGSGSSTTQSTHDPKIPAKIFIDYSLRRCSKNDVPYRVYRVTICRVRKFSEKHRKPAKKTD